MIPILPSIKYVVDWAESVHINTDALDSFSKELSISSASPFSAISAAPASFIADMSLSKKELIHFFLLVHSMNFCYWEEPKWTMEFSKKEKTYVLDGATALFAAVGNEVREFVFFGESYDFILNPLVLSEMSCNNLASILEGSREIPLLKERHKNVNEIGRVLLEKYKNNGYNLIKEGENDAVKILENLVKNFPSYEDTSVYKGEKIFFYKRAQLCVSDISRVFDKSFGKPLTHVSHLTAAADYKIPQVLRKEGILVYEKSLAEKIDNKMLFEKDSPEEVEIRASMIWAIECIKRNVQTTFPKVTAMDIDEYLWVLGQQKFPDDKPYHRTVTTAY